MSSTCCNHRARLASALAGKLVKDSGCYRLRPDGRGAVLSEAVPSTRAAPVTFKVSDVADGVVRHYEANVALVEHLAKSFGFRPLFFWQPTVFTKPTLVPVEREEARKFAWAEPFMSDVYDQDQVLAATQGRPGIS